MRLRFRAVTVGASILVAVATTVELAQQVSHAAPESHTTTNGPGYWMLGASGTVYPFGSASTLGNAAAIGTAAAIAPTSDGGGYWVASTSGQVENFGDAAALTASTQPSGSVVTIAATVDAKGYWLATSTGEIVTAGDAVSYGNAPAGLNAPIVNMVVTPDSKGYWMLGGDGGVFSFGDAQFFGSTGAIKLNKPAVAMAPTADGAGYWFVAADGGIFSFGDATYYGSMGGVPLAKPVIGMVVTADTHGYWLDASDGGVFTFGDAGFVGSLGGQSIPAPIVGFADVPAGGQAPPTTTTTTSTPTSTTTTSTTVLPVGGSLQKSFFGISVNAFPQGAAWPVPASVPFPTAGKAVSGSYWAQVEPSAGTYNWEPIDNWLSAGKAAGVTTFTYTFFETPAWASSNPSQTCSATAGQGIYGCAAPPSNITDWENFVTALVTRYAGQIQYFELWNEANVSTEWSGSVAQMIQLAQTAYSIIKSIDPGAVVIAPSPSFGGILSSTPNCSDTTECWLASYLAAGGGQYADAIAFHGKACTNDTTTCSSNNIGCPDSAIDECGDGPLITQITDVKSIMAVNGLSSKPIIDTEGGYGNATALLVATDMTADQQAAYFSRFYITQASENVSVAVLFDWCGCSVWSGLGTAAAEPEILADYTQTYNWLVGATMGGVCTESSSSVWTCPLTLASGKSALIVWSDSATSFTPTGSYTTYQTLSGSTSTISGAVPIGILPELLEQ